MPVRSLRDGTIKVQVADDGAGSAASVTVTLEEGDLEFTERRPVTVVKDRGVLDHARPAADEAMELSFSFMLQQFTDPDSADPTVYEALKHIEDASAWETQETDSDSWAVDLEFTITDPAGGASEVLTFDRFHPSEVQMQEGEEFDVITASGVSVQRSPFPLLTDLPGLVALYEADQITGVADGGAVAEWPDQTGHGHDLAQATGASQPTLQTNEVNGLPVVRFDGSDDLLAVDLVSTFEQAFTLFVVAKHTTGAVAADEAIVGGLNEGADASGQILAKAAATDTYSASAGTELTFGALNASFRVIAVAFDGASSVARIDGTETTGDAGARTLSQLSLGALPDGTLPADCDVATLALYRRKLTTAQMLLLEDYAAWKYAL